MQTTQVRSLGYKALPLSVPASVEEFDQLAKRSGAALDEANKNVIYRSTLAEFRDSFLHGYDAVKDEAGNVVTDGFEGIEKRTGIERKTKVKKPEVKDADGKVTQQEVLAFDETEEDYYDRVLASLVSKGDYASIDAARASFEPLAIQVLGSIAFDPSKTERKAGPRVTPKQWNDVATAMVDAWKEKLTAQGFGGSAEELAAEALARATARFTEKTGRKVEAVTHEALAKAVWEDQLAQKKLIAAGYVS